ncbi:MAG: CHASE3 domain-containing protein [Cytophagales bacterium]|nr:CHASE3 domain-containing protein [Cytophagales bacterium]
MVFKFRKEKSLDYALLTVIVLVAVSVTLYFVNRSVIEHNFALKKQADQVQEKTRYIIRGVVQRLDVGVRGYALTKNETLLKPVALAKKDFQATFDTLETMLAAQNYPQVAEVKALRRDVQGYIDFCEQMIAAVKIDSMAQFSAMMAQDRGTALWYAYEPVSKHIAEYEGTLNQQAEQTQRNAHRTNGAVQLLLLGAGIPILGLVTGRLRKLRKAQKDLLLRLESNNRQYLFDPGTEWHGAAGLDSVENSIENFRKADVLISAVAEGNYTVEWPGLSDENRQANENTLAGKLVRMRDKMQAVRRDEEQRIWATEGLAQFSALVRAHQQDPAGLAQEAVRFLVKYVAAQQGGLFVLREENTGTCLELAACYAFNRKKFVQKRVEIGEGLVGQTYLEGETTLLTEVPQGYTSITSGLGDATPGCLLLVPMKQNDTVVAVLELASFATYQPHQVAFIEKAGEFVASALTNAQNAARMQMLLEQSQQQTEMMKAQEEEMRQNLEELAATQEEMMRKERELEEKLRLAESEK